MNEKPQSENYAVIASGGKQYTVAPGDRIRVEKLDGEAGKSISFGEVLLVKSGTEAVIGDPFIKGATVTAKLVAQAKAPKIIVFKKRRRKGYKLKRGHRQPYTEVIIESINS